MTLNRVSGCRVVPAVSMRCQPGGQVRRAGKVEEGLTQGFRIVDGQGANARLLGLRHGADAPLQESQHPLHLALAAARLAYPLTFSHQFFVGPGLPLQALLAAMVLGSMRRLAFGREANRHRLVPDASLPPDLVEHRRQGRCGQYPGGPA